MRRMPSAVAVAVVRPSRRSCGQIVKNLDEVVKVVLAPGFGSSDNNCGLPTLLLNSSSREFSVYPESSTAGVPECLGEEMLIIEYSYQQMNPSGSFGKR